VRFSLRSLLVLFLGIAIGYSLNVGTLRLLMSPAGEGRMSALPTYVIEPPDVLELTQFGEFTAEFPAVSGKYPVGPDGRINLGAFGSVYLAGKTIDEARQAVETAVGRHVSSPQILIDVYTCNSKKYYVVTKKPGGDNVTEGPITGNETVLDAIARIGGIPQTEATDIWIARPALNGIGLETLLRVDWEEITSGASVTTNYQLMPRDRLFISSSRVAEKAE
jgi:protein involved in polysaccharide export with SLBB domain